MIEIIAAPEGSRCQEASPQSRTTYIACGAPAKFVVQTSDTPAYLMCAACADHNVRNRGAHYVAEGERYVLYVPSTPDAEPSKSATATPAAFTPAQVTKIYIDAKDAAEAMSKKHAAEMEPLSKRMDLARSWLLKYLNEQGLNNAKTEYGMAYKSDVLQATVDPDDGWSKLLAYVFKRAIERALDYIEQGGRDDAEGIAKFLEEPSLALLNRSVNKTAVKELLDQGATVPGVKIATITNLNVRRS